MHYLYCVRPDRAKRLVATFDSEQQLLAYVRWATLGGSEGEQKFEQGSVLVGCRGYEHTQTPPPEAETADVAHNPTPSML